MTRRMSTLILCLLAAGIPWQVRPAQASGFADLESQVQEFTLPNGLTFLVLSRHDAPVFTFRTYVNAGGVDEVAGITGIAHMLEHMAFKGTETIGTTDRQAEMLAIARVDEALEALEAERARGPAADPAVLERLEQAFKEEMDRAFEYSIPNDFSRILEENGAVNLNAFTEMDATQYYYSLPSNRIELWARLEGDRMTQPVLREFYKERMVVQEERRFGESSPMQRAFMAWWMSSFLAHPYGNGLIGHPSDLESITRQDAWDFFRKHYVGRNMTIALVGDVDLQTARELAGKYFSGVSAAPPPPPLRTREPAHTAEIRVTVEEDSQPFVVVGFMVPGALSPDAPVYELMADILASGRSSRLYERLVKQDGIAVNVAGGTGFPGDKYDNLLVLHNIVARDATPGQVEAAVYEELDRLAGEGPTGAELDKVRRRARASFIRRVRSDSGLAGLLAEYQQKHGDWRKLFRYLDELEAVTAEDIREAAQRTFRHENRTVGILRRPES